MTGGDVYDRLLALLPDLVARRDDLAFMLAFDVFVMDIEPDAIKVAEFRRAVDQVRALRETMLAVTDAG